MATTVTDPNLPLSTGTYLAADFVAFDETLLRTLQAYLQTLAMAINERLPLDGSLPMEGSLDMGGFDITNVDDITANNYNGSGSTIMGDVYLSLDSGSLEINRENGKWLFINGVNELVPSGGVSLSGSGITTTGGASSTALYYIYAYMNAGTMTLEYSATAYAVDTTYGHKIKSGDGTRTLVGMWMAASANTWSTVAVQGVSWFNPKRKFTGVGPVSSTTSSGSTVEISSSLRNTFITFSDRLIYADMQVGLAGHSGAAQNLFFTIGLDGVSTVLWTTIQQWRSTNSSANTFYAPHHARFVVVSEGIHYVTPAYQTSSATLSASNVHMDVLVWG